MKIKITQELNELTVEELNELTVEELNKLADLMDIGISFTGNENNIDDLKGELVSVLSTEPVEKINYGLRRLHKK